VCVHLFILSFSYCVYQGSFFSNHCQHFFVCCMFCPIDLLYYSLRSHFKSLQSSCILLIMIHVSDPYNTILHIIILSSATSESCFIYFSVILPSSRNSKYLCPITVLLLISLWQLASVVIILHRYPHSFIYSVSFPPMCRPILTTVFSVLILNTIFKDDRNFISHVLCGVLN